MFQGFQSWKRVIQKCPSEILKTLVNSIQKLERLETCDDTDDTNVGDIDDSIENVSDNLVKMLMVISDINVGDVSIQVRRLEDLTEDDLEEKRRVRPAMQLLYSAGKSPRFFNGKLYDGKRPVHENTIQQLLAQAASQQHPRDESGTGGDQ